MASNPDSSDAFSSMELFPVNRQLGRRQGVWWILTIKHHLFVPYLPPACDFVRGQLELGEGGSNYLHWQVCAHFRRKVSLGQLQVTFGQVHAELTRSSAAIDYVFKESTRVPGTQFELGARPFDRSNSQDWDQVWNLAVRREIMGIPSDIRVRCYSTLRRIGEDYMEPTALLRSCAVFWGRTGTGKSRRAWEEAGMEAYSKDPRTKFWCGYRDQEHVIIDEFRGSIDIAHLLRWTDRYPVSVEVKGGARPFNAKKIWITSNLCPQQWYPDVDAATLDALLRRLTVVFFE